VMMLRQWLLETRMTGCTQRSIGKTVGSLLLAALLSPSFGLSQDTDKASASAKESMQEEPAGDSEETALRRAVVDAQGSQIDMIRNLERHLQQFPKSKRREEIELVLLKASTEINDDTRVLRYGQAFLDTGANQTSAFDRVLPLMLRSTDKATSEKALAYAKRYEASARELDQHLPQEPAHRRNSQKQQDRALGRALVFQARAWGNLGDTEKALAVATASYETEPTAEAARELGKWLRARERKDEAIDRYAEAFVIDDGYTTPAQRMEDRQRLGEFYRENHETEKGLGDVVLAAYDRTRVHRAAYEQKLLALAPNADATKASDFTLSALDGDPLALASLRGKVVVVDFWATWCGPCRRQHPLYEEVKARFAKSDQVLFLSVNTDEDRSIVKPFLEENDWKQPVHFEDGLVSFLRVSSIPTTIVFGADGQVFSRMNGYVPETFVDQLSERVKEALGSTQSAQASR